MFYLILAILSSTFVSVFMRLGDKFIKNEMVMFSANYALAVGLSAFFMRDHIIPDSFHGMGFAMLIGFLSGALYLLNFVLLHLNIHRNGVVLSSMFMKLGVLVPTLMAVTLFHEKAKPFQVVGFVLALIAIIIINSEKPQTEEEESKSEGEGKKYRFAKVWLIVMLFVSGITDSLANVYDKQGVALLKDHYLFCTFLAAFLFSLVMAVWKKEKVRIADILCGFAIGVPNYFSARFLLLALGSLPAVVVYPANNVATILCISMFGVLLFKEHVGKRKFIGFVMILFALVFLNV